MSNTRPVNGNVLPSIVDPPRRCITFKIPDEPQHVAAFFGALLQLAYWFNWQRDEAHTGKDVAQVWFEVFNEASKNWLDHECGGIVVNNPGASTEMAIRQNPDNPCLLESSLDGTDWCVFADLSKCLNFGTQPGQVTDQPKPGGGTQETCKRLSAAGVLYVPTVVNSGDQITLSMAQGSGNDLSDPDGSGIWRLPNGNQNFGGFDVGHAATTGTDPLPSVNHMKIIANVGGGAHYLDLPVGTPVTVPGGVVNASLYIQVNDSDLSNNFGDYDVCVVVKNNQTLQWTHVFDFTKSPFNEFFTQPTHGYLSGPMGVWVAGTGWTGSYVTGTDGQSFNGIYLSLDEVINYTEVRADFSIVAGSNVSVHANYSFEYNYYPGPVSHNQVALPTIAASPQIDGSPISSTNLEIQMLSGHRDDGADPGGTSLLTTLTIGGSGTDPFA